MRRFLLLVFVSCAAASAVFALMPSQLAGYLALFERHTLVNSGVAVTVLAVADPGPGGPAGPAVALGAGPGQAAPRPGPAGRPRRPRLPVYPVSSWGSRPVR